LLLLQLTPHIKHSFPPGSSSSTPRNPATHPFLPLGCCSRGTSSLVSHGGVVQTFRSGGDAPRLVYHCIAVQDGPHSSFETREICSGRSHFLDPNYLTLTTSRTVWTGKLRSASSSGCSSTAGMLLMHVVYVLWLLYWFQLNRTSSNLPR
jgi:hypothetical protein